MTLDEKIGQMIMPGWDVGAFRNVDSDEFAKREEASRELEYLDRFVKPQLEKHLDHGSAGGDENHHIVKVCIVVDALDPGWIRRARERQRRKRGDRHQKDWKDRQRESTTICGEFIQHGLWISFPPHFVKQLRIL